MTASLQFINIWLVEKGPFPAPPSRAAAPTLRQHSVQRIGQRWGKGVVPPSVHRDIILIPLPNVNSRAVWCRTDIPLATHGRQCRSWTESQAATRGFPSSTSGRAKSPARPNFLQRRASSAKSWRCERGEEGWGWRNLIGRPEDGVFGIPYILRRKKEPDHKVPRS